MKKMTLDHSEAVSAAKLNMIRIADQATTPGFKREIEKRVTLLGEVYWQILDSIYHPGLPLNEELQKPGPDEPRKPQDNGTAAKQG